MLLAAGSLVAGLVHIGVCPEHFREADRVIHGSAILFGARPAKRHPGGRYQRERPRQHRRRLTSPAV